MPQARAAATAAAIWRALGRAGMVVYAVAALLVAALVFAIDGLSWATHPFDASELVADLLTLTIIGGVLALSARFSHPVLRLVTGAVFLGYEISFMADIGLGRTVSSLARPLVAKAEAARCILFCAAQLASMLITAAVRTAMWFAARHRARRAA